MNDQEPQFGWTSARELVLAELKRLSGEVKELGEKIGDGKEENNGRLEKLKSEYNDEIGDMKTQIALLQLKCSLWGALAGIAAGLAVKFIR